MNEKLFKTKKIDSHLKSTLATIKFLTLRMVTFQCILITQLEDCAKQYYNCTTCTICIL